MQVSDAKPNSQSEEPAGGATGEAATFDAQGLLLEQFRFRGTLANQMRQERIGLYTLYLITVGATSTIATYYFGLGRNSGGSNLQAEYFAGSAIALGIAGLVGGSFTVRLRQLGAEYVANSVRMAGITDYYLKHLKHPLPQDKDMPTWHDTTIPSYRQFAGEFMLWLMIILGSLAFSLASVILAGFLTWGPFTSWRVSDIPDPLVDLATFVLALSGHIVVILPKPRVAS